MKLRPCWTRECIDRGPDSNVGARLFQLTSGAAISHNIYCEQRYTTADGSRLALLRSERGLSPAELWACDLRTKEVAFLADCVHGAPATSLYSDAFYYVRRPPDGGPVLLRLDLKSLEQEEAFDLTACAVSRYGACTVSPDERYYVGRTRINEHVWGLWRVDLRQRTWDVFHEHEDICNPHPQFEPSKGPDILVQHNRGCIFDDQENIVRLVGEEGATLYVIDRDGGNLRRLPVGKPHTPPVTGHECWIADTGQVLLTAGGGEIHVVAPGDQASRCIWRGLPFCHISSAGDDGRYFVVDDMTNGRVYVGNIHTGRMLPLCDTGTSCSRPQYTHSHPYMTPDGRYVIFNSDRCGLAQVWAAEVPDGLLSALDEPTNWTGSLSAGS